ncbi:NAD(P)H-dependent glycerol-3-phosphate dehydrogenase [Halobacteriovorax sp. HLS]|uniref:NAD(P)H-dependent glycerol-3-phosphate dehydrogenase n=1 Tax=Halobacteriovorax sp. HLS TaxID=2234000 RepID=UPI0013E2F3A9|nr:NAD(P)H-dependent glycerol-3-phosphate dehydrogenase [Halobacteriovorax sp. HLS]
MSYDCALVVGAGAFGTALASVLANNFKQVILKVRSEDVYNGLLEGENSVYLPGLKLSSNIIPALTWEEVDEKTTGKIEIIVSGLPTAGISSFFQENFDRFSTYLDKNIPIVSLSKGIDPETLELADDLFFDLWSHHRELFTFLSGPSFAKEILEEQITLVTLAGRSRKVLQSVSKMLDTSYFKVLPSYDIKGVLLGGALKNILAIAGGIVEGLGYNHNTRAAMITRGIAEMLRFGKVYNARPETFYGLSGMGDLILTTTGDLSRNKSFGLELAKGRTAEEIIASQRTVVEGYKTAKAVHLVSKKYEIRANIFQGVYRVLYENADPQEVLTKLMRQPAKFELD